MKKYIFFAISMSALIVFFGIFLSACSKKDTGNADSSSSEVSQSVDSNTDSSDKSQPQDGSLLGTTATKENSDDDYLTDKEFAAAVKAENNSSAKTSDNSSQAYISDSSSQASESSEEVSNSSTEKASYDSNNDGYFDIKVK